MDKLKDCVLNPKIIEVFYGDREPNFSDVLINSFQVLPNEDTTIRLNLIVRDFPDNPPKKWILNKYDTAAFSLQLNGVFDVHIDGLDFVDATSIEFKKLSESEISISSGINFRISCKWIHVDGIEGFTDEIKTYPYDK